MYNHIVLNNKNVQHLINQKLILFQYFHQVVSIDYIGTNYYFLPIPKLYLIRKQMYFDFKYSKDKKILNNVLYYNINK